MRHILVMLAVMQAVAYAENIEHVFTVGPLSAYESIVTKDYSKVTGFTQGVIGWQEFFFPSGASAIISARFLKGVDFSGLNLKDEQKFDTAMDLDMELFMGGGFRPVVAPQASLELFVGFGYERLKWIGVHSDFNDEATAVIFITDKIKLNVVFMIVGFKHDIKFGSFSVQNQGYIKPNIRPYYGQSFFFGPPMTMRYGYSARYATKFQYRCVVGREYELALGVMPYVDYGRYGRSIASLTATFEPPFFPIVNPLTKFIAGAALICSVNW